MPVSHPIRIEYGLSAWRVFPQEEDFASVRFGGTADAVPGRIYYRFVSEKTGKDVIPWTPAERSGSKWSAAVRLPAGGPYRAETCAKDDATMFKDAVGGDLCNHIFAGDLFLVAGQSNAVGYARDAVRDGPCIGVSMRRWNGRWDLADHPLHDGTGSVCDILEVPVPAHSPWLAFAKRYYRETGVPVGLLPAAMGGSPMDAWDPGAGLYTNAVRLVKEAGAIRGVFWIQGCADALALQHERYLQRFLHMVAAFREETGLPELPFFTFQLNGFTEPAGAEVADAFTAVRGAQLLAAEQPGVYCLPTAGLPLYDQIHNSAASNLRIGRQAADLALAVLWDRPCRTEALAVRSCEISENTLTLTVGPVTGRLLARRVSAAAFEAYADGKIYPVERLSVSGNRIILTGAELHRAKELRYAQGADLTAAGVSDSDGGRVLQPFAIHTDYNRKRELK